MISLLPPQHPHHPHHWLVIQSPTTFSLNYQVHPDATIEAIQEFIETEEMPHYDLYLEECDNHQETLKRLEEAQAEIVLLRGRLAKQISLVRRQTQQKLIGWNGNF